MVIGQRKTGTTRIPSGSNGPHQQTAHLVTRSRGDSFGKPCQSAGLSISPDGRASLNSIRIVHMDVDQPFRYSDQTGVRRSCFRLPYCRDMAPRADLLVQSRGRSIVGDWIGAGCAKPGPYRATLASSAAAQERGSMQRQAPSVP